MMSFVSHKRYILLALSILLVMCKVNAQTFTCTDYNNYEDSPQIVQKFKKEALGLKSTLEFYDNSVKLTFYMADGNTEVAVLDKVSNNSYKYAIQRGKKKTEVTISLETVAGYIKSFTLRSYSNSKLTTTMAFKRKVF